MNKNLYRLVFNKLRGMLMAVAEVALSQSKASGSTRTSPHAPAAALLATLRPLTLSLLCAAGLVSLALPAQAQIVVDHGAPKQQQPTVVNAANGVPVINIQTPSAGACHAIPTRSSTCRSKA